MSDLRIPFPTERAAKRELSLLQWGVLINTTFPSALSEDAIINAWDLAQVRGLDVFSGHVAIVNQRRKVDNNWINQESCWLTLKAQIFVAHKLVLLPASTLLRLAQWLNADIPVVRNMNPAQINRPI